MNDPNVFPDDAAERLTRYLATHYLPKGLGTEDEACSIAAINLALTGKLTDAIPECMSLAIGRWVIFIQDTMPDETRNSIAWKVLLPLAAGTGRDRETDRLQIIMSWVWDDVLPQLSLVATAYGFSVKWQSMLTEKTVNAANAAANAAYAAASAAHAAAYAAANAAHAAARAAAYAAANAAVDAAANAAHAAAYAAANTANAADAIVKFWANADPVTLLHKLIMA